MQVIGHRGAAALAPENTWPGFDLALELGVDAVETDVRATSDGVLVLLHDERLDRTTEGEAFQELAMLLHEQAVLAEGGQLADPVAFVRRVNRLVAAAGEPAAGD